MVTLIDYGLGNIQAFANVYRRLNIAVEVARDPAAVLAATHLILPGVGAFDWAMDKLDRSGMRSALDKKVLELGCPVLGVCVGMQMMALRSEEGTRPGLGWLNGEVLRFQPVDEVPLALPHMGWNDVTPVTQNSIISSIEAPRFYFLHSFYFSANDPDIALSTTNYGKQFVSAAGRGQITGVQFHPEKSHGWGTSLLKNFAEL